MMEEKEELEKFVAENQDLEKLEELLQEFNIFEALGIVKEELRHSNFLAWLLDPQATHGISDYFLKKLLLHISIKGKMLGISTLPIVDVEGWDLTHTRVEREWRTKLGNIDILIRNDDFDKKIVAIIENKILSGEGEGQLSKYRKVCESEFKDIAWRIFVFLTPEGHPPREEEDAAYYIPLSYGEIYKIVERMLKARESTMSESVRSFINHYAKILNRYIMSDSEIQQLCKKIYSTHKKAVDLILEHRPDNESAIAEFLKELIKEHPFLSLDDSTKNYVRFIPSTLDKKEWQTGAGWTSTGRILLFEFQNFSDWALELKLIVGPGPDGIRDELIQKAKNNSDLFNKANRKPGKQWFSIFAKRFLTKKYLEDETFDVEEAKKKIKAEFEKFLANELPPVVEKLTL